MNTGFNGKMIGNGRTCGPNINRMRPLMRIRRPIVTITIAKPDSPTRREKKMRSMISPKIADTTIASGSATNSGSPVWMTIHQTMKPPNTTSSPCAKLNTFDAR